MATLHITRRRLVAVATGTLLFIAIQALPVSQAVEMQSLYTVEVERDRSAADPQARAYADALSAVLVRVTGDESAATDEDLLGLFPNPQRYVLQFQAGDGNTLIVTLDGAAIVSLLRRAGQPVWGSDRPLTIVWLAVDRGMGEREIVGAAADDQEARFARLDPNRELRERVLGAAERRGIPMVFPLLDSEDREAVTSSDIWGGFDDALLAASRRYGTSSILVGRVQGDDTYSNRWSYFFGNQQLTFTGSPETAVNMLADALAEQFAFAGNAPLETVTLTISGIESVSGYGALQRLLSGVSAIESFKVDTVAGSEIRYVVQVRGGTDRLASALEFSGFLQRSDWLGVDDLYAEENASASLEYAYRPVRDLPPAAETPPGNIEDNGSAESEPF